MGIASANILRRRLLEVLLAPPVPEKMSYKEFPDWADEDTVAEWVNGKAIMTSPASGEHQTIADFLLNVMGLHSEAHQTGLVISALFQMKLERG